MIYVYIYENIFQDNSIHIIFTFANSELLMIYIPNIWPEPCPKRLLNPIRMEYIFIFWVEIVSVRVYSARVYEKTYKHHEDK